VDLCEDERFKSVSGRVSHREVLVPLVAQIMLNKTMQEWLDLLNTVNVPCGPIYNLEQVFEDPQVQHRHLKMNMKHSSGSMTPQIASPMRFSETPVSYRTAAPMLGEHTEAVLQRLAGVTGAEVEALRGKGVL
jgi:crotonobetainyl-CoA:carnitine CoA-transferase CaiB-like acyl-CoA transferase